MLLLIGIPIISGVLCLFLSDKLKNLTRAMAFIVTLAALSASILVFINKPLSWQGGTQVIFIADNLSGFIGMSIALFAFLVTIYSFGFIDRSYGTYFGYLLITLGGSFGTIFSNDLLVLLVFWGLLTIPLYMLINVKGTDAASSAAKKAMIIIGGTDSLMIFGIGAIWLMTKTVSMNSIHLKLDAVLPFIAYISILIAALAKAGAMPFHSWIPDVAEDSPAPVTAYLPASLDKLLGIYLLARVSLNLFIMNSISNTILLVIGSVTIVLAVIFALIQHDLKRLLGYHAVSQVGYMVLGIGTGNPVGIAGALFHMLNHAVYKSCLFLCGGNVEKRAGTTDLANLGGLSKYMPVTFASFLIASLSISGIPPFNGFVSKWMIYQGIIETAGAKNPLWVVWLVAAIFGSALTLASFMKLVHAIFLGRPSENSKKAKEAGFFMSFPVIALAGISFVFGVFAFVIPIRLFIAPSVSGILTYAGIWDPTLATTLIVIGIVAGLLVYLLFREMKFRTVPTFIGGGDPDELGRVSGTEFYNTIKEMKWLDKIYKKEEAKSFDIYEAGSKATFFFTRKLQWLHNGVLPTYLVWCLIGTLILFLMVMR